MLDLQLRRFLIDFAFGEALHDFALELEKAQGSPIVQSSNRDYREARIELSGRHGVARSRADEGLLEFQMRNGLARADEARAELAASGANLEIRQDRLATADSAGHKHRPLA